MLVKYNLYINQEFSIPDLKGNYENAYIQNGKLYVKNLEKYIVNFIPDWIDSKYTSDGIYSVGFEGTCNGRIDIYKHSKEGYKIAINKGDLYYQSFHGDRTSKLHLRGYGKTSLVIEKVFIVEGDIADLIIANPYDHKDKNSIYPPEGEYKEIQAR